MYNEARICRLLFYSFFMWMITKIHSLLCVAALLNLMELWKMWHALQGSSLILIIIIVELLHMHAKLKYIQRRDISKSHFLYFRYSLNGRWNTWIWSLDHQLLFLFLLLLFRNPRKMSIIYNRPNFFAHKWTISLLLIDLFQSG